MADSRPDGGPRIGDLLRATARLIDRLDAEVLLAHHLGMARLDLLRDTSRRVFGAGYAALVARRMAGEPVAYITGTREFWSLPLRVTPATLIPRPDSETLIAEALVECAGRTPAHILDLGTGSGALLLAALTEWPAANGLGVDCSAAALAVARTNAEALGMAGRASFCAGNWGDELTGPFDLILANPPYIPEGTALMHDVAGHEPHGALFAGADGLDAYRCIFPALDRLLAAGGVAILEFGEGQSQPIAELAAHHGFSCRIAADLAARPRAAVCRRK